MLAFSKTVVEVIYHISIFIFSLLFNNHNDTLLCFYLYLPIRERWTNSKM